MARPREEPLCKRSGAGTPKAKMVELHKAKMARKARERAAIRIRDRHPLPASINRNTGKPHEHKREIARRLLQKGV